MWTRTLDPLALTPTSTFAGLLTIIYSTHQHINKSQRMMHYSLHPISTMRFINGPITSIASYVSKSSIDYIRHNTLKNCLDPFGYFYLTIKIHKTPVSTCPVCSNCASIVHSLGKWLDYALQPIVKEQQSYFKDVFALKHQLVDLDLPLNVSLITFDAVSMYTKIDINDCIERVSTYLATIWDCDKCNAVTQAMEIVGIETLSFIRSVG